MLLYHHTKMIGQFRTFCKVLALIGFACVLQFWDVSAARAVNIAIRIHSDYAQDKCLDADVNTIAENGTKVQMWECIPAADDNQIPPNQMWFLPGDGTIRNALSKRCLDVKGDQFPRNEAIVQLWDCWGGPNQKWNTTILNPNDRDRQYIQIQGTTQCLDAYWSTNVPHYPDDGTQVQLYTCQEGQNQFWTTSNQLWLAVCSDGAYFPIIGLIWQRYKDGPNPYRMGCAQSNEVDIGDGARYQVFEKGAMVFSPSTAPGLVLAGYFDNHQAWAWWCCTDPYTYDFFNVQATSDYVHFYQYQVLGDRNEGAWAYEVPSGELHVQIEGCDHHGWPQGDTCNQGWSKGVFVRIPPNR